MKKFIKILKSISLSQKEKDVLRYKIEQFISFNPIRNEIHIPKKSFYFSIFTFRALGKGVALVLIALTALGGTGVSYASNDALPGDRLYNVKINVNEKIEEKLALTSKAKAVVKTEKVERRLTEAQKLVEKKDFSPEKKEIVKTNLEKNVSDAIKSIENLKDEGKIEEALDTASRIAPVLEAHKKVLTEQRKSNQNNSDDKEKESTIKTDSETQTSALSVESESDTEVKLTKEEELGQDLLLESVIAALEKVEEVESRVIERVNEDQKTAEEVTEKTTRELVAKIENLKKENIEIEIKTKEEGQSDKNSEEEGDSKTSSSEDKTLVGTEIKTFGILEGDSVKTITVIDSKTDAEIGVKEAENLLLLAENAKTRGDFKEALTLSQEARKIIGQIEQYNKIKNLETENAIKSNEKLETSNTEEKSTDTKESEEESTAKPTQETESLEKETEVKVDLETEAEKEIPLVDIKSEAIKSLEETNASLKKINFSLSGQTRLLP